MNKFSATEQIREKLACISGSLFDSNMDALHHSGPLLMHRAIPFEENFIDDSESHVAIAGCTGYGKSRRALAASIMTAILKGEDILIEDPKGEHFRSFSGIAKSFGYRVRLLNLNKVENSEGYNVFEYVIWLWKNGRRDEAATELQKIVKLILPEKNWGNDPFWCLSGQDVLFGTGAALLEAAEPEQMTLESMLRFINDSGKGNGFSENSLSKFLNKLPADSIARTMLEDYCNTARDTAAGMRSSAVQPLKAFDYCEEVKGLLSTPDIKISSIESNSAQPVIYFVILPEQNKALFPVASIFISQIMNRYIDLADNRYGGSLPNRLNVFIDELPAIAQTLAETFVTYISTCRSRNIRIYYVIQSFEQLSAAFGKGERTVLDNTGTMIIFRMNTDSSAAVVTNMLGSYEYVNPYSGDTETKSIMRTSDICSMQVGQAVVISGGLKFISWLPDYTEIIPSAYTSMPPATVKIRKRKKVKPFDMKNYTARPATDRVRNIGTTPPKNKPKTDQFKVPELFIGDFRMDDELRDAITKIRKESMERDRRSGNTEKVKKEIEKFTKKGILDTCKVTLLNLGHNREFILRTARTCDISISATVQMLYMALDEPLELYFDSIMTAVSFAANVEATGGTAELIYLEDEEDEDED